MSNICASCGQCHRDIFTTCDMERCGTLVVFVINAGASIE
jgi:hypothetical protein